MKKNLPSVLMFTQYRQKNFFHILVILSENLNIILKQNKKKKRSGRVHQKNMAFFPQISTLICNALFFCWIYKNLSLLVSNFQIILVVVAILLRFAFIYLKVTRWMKCLCI